MLFIKDNELINDEDVSMMFINFCVRFDYEITIPEHIRYAIFHAESGIIPLFGDVYFKGTDEVEYSKVTPKSEDALSGRYIDNVSHNFDDNCTFLNLL